MKNRKYKETVPEPVLFLRFWKWLNEQCTGSGNSTLALYGAGKFLKRFLPYVWNESPSQSLKYIIDDNAENISSGSFPVPVITPQQAQSHHIDIMVPATDSAEKDIIGKIQEIFAAKVTIKTFSDFQKINRIRRCGRAMNGDLYHAHSDKAMSRPVKSLDALLVSVGYGHILKQTLPFNIHHFDRFIIVSSSNDSETREAVEQFGGTLVVSDSYADEGSFNKGKMLNFGMEAIQDCDWLLVTDADIILPANFRNHINESDLNNDALYCASRLNAPIKNLPQWLEKFKADQSILLDYEPDQFECSPIGYFQLFNRHSKYLNNSPPLFCEKFLTAGGVDYHFFNRWPNTQVKNIHLETVHIPHGSLASTWSGHQLNCSTPAPNNWKPIAYDLQNASCKSFREIPKNGFIRFMRSDTAEDIVCSVTDFRFNDNSLGVADSSNDIAWGRHVLPDDSQAHYYWNSESIPPCDFEIAWKQKLSS